MVLRRDESARVAYTASGIQPEPTRASPSNLPALASSPRVLPLNFRMPASLSNLPALISWILAVFKVLGSRSALFLSNLTFPSLAIFKILGSSSSFFELSNPQAPAFVLSNPRALASRFFGYLVSVLEFSCNFWPDFERPNFGTGLSRIFRILAALSRSR